MEKYSRASSGSPLRESPPTTSIASQSPSEIPGRKYSLSGQGVGQNIIRGFSFQPLICASRGRRSRGAVLGGQPAGTHGGVPKENHVTGIAEGYGFVELRSGAGSHDIARN